jgi:ABC-2 type transport system ATP-binding protein
LETKRKIGYLPEANPLYYDMYVREYLLFIAGVHKISNPKQAIDRVIELTGLSMESKKKTGQLSKGYKQRVGLAAALVHDPEVLILDEPTSGLDPNQIVEIRNVIKQQGQNKTVLFSSHILQEVQAICDRVIIINKGVIVADDSLVHLQQTKGGATLQVSFNTPVDIQMLQNLPAVTSVTNSGGGNWQLASPNTDEARKQVLELAIRHNLDIVSLGTRNNNLEEIFRELTNG